MATYYFRNSGDVNWGTATNWSLSSGGPADGAVPTSSDDAIFDASSGNCTVNASARVCKTLNFTNYTNTITMSNSITVSGNITLGASMGIAGTGALAINATSTITSNGKTWGLPLYITATATVTLADNWTVSSTGTQFLGTGTMNGNTLYVTANVTQSNFATLTGTTVIEMTGTGNLGNNAASTVVISNPIRINTSGTITIGLTAALQVQIGPLTIVAGTVNQTSILSLYATGTYTFNGKNWGHVYIYGITATLADNLTCTQLTYGNSGTATVNTGGGNIYCSGNVAGVNNTNLQGTAKLYLTGTTNWSHSSTTGYGVFIDVEINTSGTITFGSNACWGATGKTFTLTSGTTSGTLFDINVGGITINFDLKGNTLSGFHVNFQSKTINLLSTGTITTFQQTTYNAAFSGAYNLTFGTLQNNTAGTTITLVNNQTYTVTTLLRLAAGTNASRQVLTSDHASNRANLTLSPGCVNIVGYVNATRIDSSGGLTVHNSGGTNTDTINWTTTTGGESAYTFVC